jgi:hypothetical protein
MSCVWRLRAECYSYVLFRASSETVVKAVFLVQVYYYNTLTTASSWEKPEGYTGDEGKASAAPTPVASNQIKGTDWIEVACDDGKHYFYNSQSKVVPNNFQVVNHSKLRPPQIDLYD